ncbi:hypothetical protein CRG98_037508 [Punica granatum]|uniref:Uncharacterized protein n=1 Tax=Punica granatum TaxID=22663 RepID=A0A2I0IDI5_PUNGR|nr:hypothetical protein CRG98_037508 [Punica granatum]
MKEKSPWIHTSKDQRNIPTTTEEGLELLFVRTVEREIRARVGEGAVIYRKEPRESPNLLVRRYGAWVRIIRACPLIGDYYCTASTTTVRSRLPVNG